jgi:hypothetical protein
MSRSSGASWRTGRVDHRERHLDPLAGGVGQLELGEEGAAAGAQQLVGRAADAVVEQRRLDSHQPGRALARRASCAGGCGCATRARGRAGPGLRQPPLRQQRAQPARVLAVGLGPPLAAAASARLGRLGQVGDGARLTQRLAPEQPARAGLDRDVDRPAHEPPDPTAHGLTVRRNASAVDLARLPVERVKGDLSPVHVKPGYDRHWGLL